MVISIPFTKLKEKVFVIVVAILFLASIYVYLHHLQQANNNAQWSGERCISELTSIKYQLNVVTEYKNRIDKLLTETQKAHESDKLRFKDIMDSCIAMKQQTTLCQSQFEDLQVECKKVKEECNKVKESEKLISTG